MNDTLKRELSNKHGYLGILFLSYTTSNQYVDLVFTQRAKSPKKSSL